MLQVQTQKNITTSLVEKIAAFDFDKHYTTKVRILCHVAMWVVIFGIVCLFNYFQGNDHRNFNYPLFFYKVFAYWIENIIIFYFLFYFAVPFTLLKNRIFLFFLCIYFCGVLFLLLMRVNVILSINIFHVDRNNFGDSLQAQTGIKFWKEVPFASLLIIGFMLLFNSPIFLVKLLFDTARSNSKRYKAERRANLLAVEKLQEETKFLRAQLNPHFLFNTFNNLYGMALRKDENMPDIILQLSSIMRYILQVSKMDKVLLSKELAFIKDYVSLEKIRYGSNKKIVLDMDETNVANQEIAPLLGFVFIENAFKYGLKSKENGYLIIKIFLENNIFYFSIINDKDFDGTEEETTKKLGGIGIDNVKKRLEMLYPEKYSLTIKEDENSFGVNLQIEIA
jgi:sensor histidine kinase YesM